MSWQDHCNKCDSCGMDMDMEPYCVNKAVIAMRVAQPGAFKTYPCGLDVSRALPLCQGKYKTPRKARK